MKKLRKTFDKIQEEVDAFAVHTRETLEKELTEKIEELEEEKYEKLEEKEENIKKILEEAQQEEKELMATEEDRYNRIKLKIQQEITHQITQLVEDKIKKLQIVKQEKEKEYQATKNYFEGLKKSYTENCNSELEQLRKKYQEAYRVEEIKEDELRDVGKNSLCFTTKRNFPYNICGQYHYKEAIVALKEGNRVEHQKALV